MRLMLVALDTLVEHTKPAVRLDEGLGYERYRRTSHPICMAICKTFAEPVMEAIYDKGDNIDQI